LKFPSTKRVEVAALRGVPILLGRLGDEEAVLAAAYPALPPPRTTKSNSDFMLHQSMNRSTMARQDFVFLLLQKRNPLIAWLTLMQSKRYNKSLPPWWGKLLTIL